MKKERGEAEGEWDQNGEGRVEETNLRAAHDCLCCFLLMMPDRGGRRARGVSSSLRTISEQDASLGGTSPLRSSSREPLDIELDSRTGSRRTD
jgi:hypothetical protein